MLGYRGERPRQPRGWCGLLPSGGRLITSLSGSIALRPGPRTVLPRLLPRGGRIHPVHCCLGTLRREIELGRAGVQLPFPFVQGRFPLLGRRVSRVALRVSHSSQFITSVSNEIALLGSPLALVFGCSHGHQIHLQLHVRTCLESRPNARPGDWPKPTRPEIGDGAQSRAPATQQMRLDVVVEDGSAAGTAVAALGGSTSLRHVDLPA